MELLFIFGKIYPFFSCGIIIALLELALYFRRKGSYLQWVCAGLISFFGITSLLWLIFDGLNNSDDWVKVVIGAS